MKTNTMKKILSLAFALFSIMSSNAQNVINSHFEYLVKNENASNVNVSGKVFQLMNGVDINEEYDEDNVDEDAAKTREFICSISSFQMVECDELPTSLSHYQKGLILIDEKYDELLSIEDEEGQFRLYVAEEDDVVSEVVGIGNYEDGLMVFSFEGELRIDQVGEAIENVHNNNFSKVNVKRVNPDDIRLYPNPLNVSQEQLFIEIPTEMVGAEARLYTTSARLVNKFYLENRTEAIDITVRTSGTYVLKIEKEGVRICKKIILEK